MLGTVPSVNVIALNKTDVKFCCLAEEKQKD